MTEKKKGRTGRPRIPMVTPDIGDLEGKLPPKPIDMDMMIYWMDLGATCAEIAGAFRVSVNTLFRRVKEITGLTFEELKEKVCGPAKIQLRKNQFNLSKSSAAMGIWLGKQWLGQKDHPHDENEGWGEAGEFLNHFYKNRKEHIKKLEEGE